MSELGDARLFVGRPVRSIRDRVVVTNREEMATLMDMIRLKPGSVTDVIFDGCDGPVIIHALPGVVRLTVKGCSHFTTLRTQPDLVKLEATGQNFSSMAEQPKLEQVYIAESSLSGLPAMPRVRFLCVRNAGLVLMPELATLEKLELYDCNHVQRVPSYPQLTSLAVQTCPELSAIDSMPRLRELYVEDCDKLATLPELPVLRNLAGYSTVLAHDDVCLRPPCSPRSLAGKLTILDYRRHRMRAIPLPRSRLSVLNGERVTMSSRYRG